MKRSSIVGEAQVPPREPPGEVPPSKSKSFPVRVKASPAVRPASNPASLLNQESCIEDEAIGCTRPVEPVNKNPCPKEESLSGAEIVEEAVDRKPLRNPKVEVVELPQEFTVKGKSPVPAVEEIVIGAPPIAVNEVQVVDPEQVTDVVATEPTGFSPLP